MSEKVRFRPNAELKLMGHSDVKTTEIYTNVMNKDLDQIKSPLDLL